MSKRTCGNCRWWRCDSDWTNQRIGLCVRRTPKREGEWPATKITDFCGEWADKAITPEQAKWRERVLRVACAIMSNGHAAGLTSEQVWARAVRFAAMDPERPQGG